MPYWSSQKIKTRLSEILAHGATDPVRQGSVELRMGPQAAVSCDGSPKVIHLKDGQDISIPEGQFALLLTEEIVKIPKNALGFISLKTGVKCQGLVNVSGFHVDPGYEGRLKFWVYNAGPNEIFLRRGERTFLIWFADFNEEVEDAYTNKIEDQVTITAKNLNDLRGAVCSPSALNVKIEKLDGRVTFLSTITLILATAALGLFASLIILAVNMLKGGPTPTDVRVQFSENPAKIVAPVVPAVAPATAASLAPATTGNPPPPPAPVLSPVPPPAAASAPLKEPKTP